MRYTLYKCDNCHHLFFDKIHNPIVAGFTTLNCKKCGSHHTYPVIHSWPKKFYEGLWEEQDKRKNKH